MKMFGATAFLALSLLLAAASGAPAAAPPGATEEVAAVVGADGVQRVEVLGGSYFFKPSHIVLKANVPVELTVRREAGMTPHDIVVNAPEAGMSFSVELATEAKTIAFTPAKVGKYAMYCDKRFLFFAGHREKGMEGILEVRE